MKINNNKYENIILTDGLYAEQFLKYKDIYEKNLLNKLFTKLKNNYFDLVLLGTGKSYIEISEDLKKFFIKNKINYEIMGSLSAYNTYNILVAEDKTFFQL